MVVPFERATTMGEKEAWRDLDSDQRYDIVLGLSKRMLARYEEGAEEHGEYFTDDPLDQLETELLDGLFYLAMARRERDELRSEGEKDGPGSNSPKPESSFRRWLRSALGAG